MTGFIRDMAGVLHLGRRAGGRRPAVFHRGGRPTGRPHNIFEAAACYVAAGAEGDEERGAQAAEWVSPEALAFGINELACRAVLALARERGRSPQEVAHELLGLPLP
ncbi:MULTISPECIES: hypothetical protein [Streptomyces]|uniref:Uncharacterized protein n=1 Tax=Streptomyces yunnanensis TaxID=156453 RepID=A0A9X8N7C1_9ACTN|nr:MULTISPECIES: hypothetical protein [Streptomyces]SHN21685.1 hypothetical protein SAMN05216268_12497 [Streptomyces yunnanensis]